MIETVRKWVEWSPEQVAEWESWLATRPAAVHRAATHRPPCYLYRMRSSGHVVYLVCYEEPADGSDVTCKVAVTDQFNPDGLVFERQVFGVSLDDLEPVDPPGSPPGDGPKS